MPFKNPYHFIPLTPARPAECLTVNDFDARRLSAATHSRYVEDTYSGRVVCRLTTITPMVIGADRQEGEPNIVTPYEIGQVPAIPASSLKGMISHIVEAASGSALRVLNNQLYPYRRPGERGLSAIGLVVPGPDGALRLKPLCLPMLTFPSPSAPSAPLPPGFRAAMWPYPILKLYLGDRQSILSPSFALAAWHPVHNNVFHAIRRNQYVQLTFDGERVLRGDTPCLHLHRHHPKLALAQQVTPPGAPPRDLSTADLRRWDEIPVAERSDWVRGIVRVLGCNPNDRSDIPETKKHEVFVPYPDELEKHPFTLPIPAHVIHRFNTLARLRSEDSARTVAKDWPGPGDPPAGFGNGRLLPYEPRGTRPGRDIYCPGVVLEPGDVVYFEPHANRPEVAEIAFSSIWRGLIEEAGRPVDTDEFFSRAFTPGDASGPGRDLLPMNPNRSQITIAEQMFGFVEMSRNRNVALQRARTLAGRLRPAPALLDHIPPELGPLASPYELDHDTNQPEIMRILASPKPPCTPLYFRARKSPAWSPPEKVTPASHVPQGRKQYLNHAAPQHITTNPDSDLHLKSAVTPVRRGAVYYFHIDFDNLTKIELSLLLYALKPYPDFLHKLGMGKPLGLGSVRIDIAGVFLVDRVARYRPDALLGGRYSARNIGPGEAPATWPAGRYQAEIQAATASEVTDWSLPATYAPPEQVEKALRRLGKPQPRVSYPRSSAQTPNTREAGGPETDLFEWFVNNARNRDHHQFLAPAADGDGLAELEENAPPA